MRRERFSNQYVSALASGIDNDDTSLTVGDGTGFPSEGDFRVVVGGELMLCTARSGDTLTVVRGIESATPVSHSSGEKVFVILTTDGLWKALQDAALLDPKVAYPRRLLDQSNTVITASTFSTWVNQGSSTITDGTNGEVILKADAVASPQSLRAAVKSFPSSPFTLTTHFNFGQGPERGSSGNFGGIILRRSLGGQCLVFGMRTNSDLIFARFNSVLSFNATIDSIPFFHSIDQWLRITYDGDLYDAYASADGVNWWHFPQEDEDTFVGTANQIGIFHASYDLENELLICDSWIEE